jgi:hypothetical protein
MRCVFAWDLFVLLEAGGDATYTTGDEFVVGGVTDPGIEIWV